eukprot:tig00020965_g16822.t1
MDVLIKAIGDFFSSSDSAKASSAHDQERRIRRPRYQYDLFLSHKQTTASDLAGRIKVELEVMRPGIRIFLDADTLDDIHDLDVNIRKTRCFVLLITPDVFESLFVLRELAAAVRSQRRILIVWDRERVPNFPQVDSQTPLPRIDEMHDAELRWTLQHVLMIKAVQYMRERLHRDAAMRELLERFDSAQPFRIEGEPPAAAAPAAAAAATTAPSPVNHSAGASRSTNSSQGEGRGSGTGLGPAGAGATRPPPPPQLPPGWSTAQNPDGQTYFWHEETGQTQASRRREHLTRESIAAAVVRAAPGQTIRLYPGWYKEELVLEKDVNIVGPREAVLECNQGVALHCAGPAAPSVKGITIRGAGLRDFPETITGIPAVQITDGSRVLLEGCDVSSSRYSGILVNGAETAPTLRGNVLHGCGRCGVAFQRSAKGVAEGNDVYGNALAGIKICTGADPIVRGNTVHDGKLCGILVFKNGRGTVEGNDVYGNALGGIEIGIGADPIVRSNMVHDGKQCGILVFENGRGTVEGNDVYGNALAGIAIDTGADPIVRGNKVHDGKKYGIHVHENGRGVVEGNDVYGNALAGICREGQPGPRTAVLPSKHLFSAAASCTGTPLMNLS